MVADVLMDRMARAATHSVTRALRDGRVPRGGWTPFLTKLSAGVVAMRRRVTLCGVQCVTDVHTSEYGTYVSVWIGRIEGDEVHSGYFSARMDADVRAIMQGAKQ